PAALYPLSLHDALPISSMVAADRFDHTGEFHHLQCLDQSFFRTHHSSARNGDLVALEQLFRFLLVAGDLHADIARTAGDRCADPFLVHAMAKLHKALSVQAEIWDPPRDSFFHDARRTWAKA